MALNVWVTQTLSASVADAIDFCREDLKLPQFKDSPATTKFIRLFDRLFDCLNSRNPVAKRFKAPLRPGSKGIWLSFLEEAKEYIRGLTGPTEIAIFKTSRKTAFLGFLLSIESTIGLASSLLLGEAAPLRYLLMYKLSQDHIELFFAAIRCKGGWNNNPTVAPFVAAYKRLVVHTEVKGGRGNCDALDDTRILEWPSLEGYGGVANSVFSPDLVIHQIKSPEDSDWSVYRGLEPK
ncbi:hypothetical protein MRX96_037120 [Rhipicephalus microplus]